MTSRDDSEIDARLLAAYLQGEVSAVEASKIDAALESDPALRRHLSELERIASTLSAPVAELEGIDLVAGVNAKLKESNARRSRIPGSFLWAAALAAAFAGFALLWGISPRALSEAEFREKSSGSATESGRRWAGIQAYRAEGSSTRERVSDRLTRSDGLVFSYTNLGPNPFEYLLVFAVDGRGRVYWFYPAYEQAGTDPEALPIEEGAPERQLPDLIRHDFATGPLSIYGLFARQRLRVSAVERWLRQAGGSASRTPPPQTSLHEIKVQVEP